MKQGIRILALDDSSFKKGERDNLIVGVVGRGDLIEGILSFRVAVDGDDATGKIIKKVRGSRFSGQIKLIVVNGIAIAGLNFVDIGEVSRSLRIPAVNIVRRKPHSTELSKAIRASGASAKKKLALLKKLNSEFKITKVGGFYVQCAGIKPAEFSRFLQSAMHFLRLAHLIASGVAIGESRGRI